MYKKKKEINFNIAGFWTGFISIKLKSCPSRENQSSFFAFGSKEGSED